METKVNVAHLYAEALKGRSLYNLGHISREEARELVNPYVLHFNEHSAKVSKKYNMTPQTISFASFCR